MNGRISPSGLAIALAGTWGISIIVLGLFSHFSGEIPGFMQAVDRLHPGSGTGPRGILIALIFGIGHGALSGWLIASIYNLYLADR